MWLRLLTSRVLNGGHAQAWGEVVEVSEADGARMLAAGQGVQVPRPEVAALAGGENAMRAKPLFRPRRGKQ